MAETPLYLDLQLGLCMYFCYMKRFSKTMSNHKKTTTMKMKKNALILVGLCALGLFSWQTQAMNIERASIINIEDNVPTGYEIIELIGDLLYGTNPNAIEAGANRNSVYLHFNQSFGNVNIKIYNATGGLCYSGVVDTTVQQTVIIPISGNNNGTYTVVLDNANGYAEGEFNR